MTTQPEIRNAHPYHMHDAMLGQPDAIAGVLTREGDFVGEFACRLAAELGQTAKTHEAEATAFGRRQLPEQVQRDLDRESEVRRWVGEVKDAERLYFVGWGSNVSIAYEASLKIKETSYVVMEYFQLEQYLHGLFLATDFRNAVTFIAPPGPGRERVTDEIGAVKAVGGHAVTIIEEGDTKISPLVDTTISLSETVDSLTPLVYMVPLQLFTYWLALELNCNPDLFRQDDPDYRMARAKYQL